MGFGLLNTENKGAYQSQILLRKLDILTYWGKAGSV